MRVNDIVSNALAMLSRTAPDVACVIGFSCVRSTGTMRGNVLAAITEPSFVDPVSDQSTATDAVQKTLVFKMFGDGGWNLSFDPQIGDTFVIGTKDYSATSVTKRHSTYYKVEVREI